jgi:hypothetical protein
LCIFVDTRQAGDFCKTLAPTAPFTKSMKIRINLKNTVCTGFQSGSGLVQNGISDS